MKVLSKTICHAAALISLALAAATGPAAAQSVPGKATFDPAKVVNGGIAITREECTALEQKDTAIWVETNGASAACATTQPALRPRLGPVL